MLLVAFSRRMCCSRVCSASRYALAAPAVDRDADDAPGERPLELVPRRHVRGVRAAIAHRHAEPLRRADGHVGPELAGGREQSQRERIGGDDRQRAPQVRLRDHFAVVVHRAGRSGILQQYAEALLGQPAMIVDDQLDADRLGAGAHDVDRLRMAVGRNEEHPARRLGEPQAERHRLRGRRALVEERRVGDRQTGEIADHGLEVEQRLEAPLRDLRLVRRVGGVPGGVLQHVAQDHRGRVAVVIAHADERLEHLVLFGDPPQRLDRLRLGAAAPEARPARSSGYCRGPLSRRARRAKPRRGWRASPPVRPRSARCGDRRNPPDGRAQEGAGSCWLRLGTTRAPSRTSRKRPRPSTPLPVPAGSA